MDGIKITGTGMGSFGYKVTFKGETLPVTKLTFSLEPEGLVKATVTLLVDEIDISGVSAEVESEWLKDWSPIRLLWWKFQRRLRAFARS